MNYANQIKNYAKKIGLDTIGFCSVRDIKDCGGYLNKVKEMGLENEFQEKDIEKRINVYDYIKDGKTIVSIAFPYFYGNNPKNKSIFFSKYTLGQDYHKVAKKYMDKVCEYINSIGGSTVSLVDSNPLTERYIAYKCGIGFIGKNGNIITEKYGSYIFLGEIITDLEFNFNNTIVESTCGKCTLCINSCPSNCLCNNGINNYNNCLSYITQKKHIEDADFGRFKGRMFGCDTCQDVCPFNKNVSLSKLPEFKPYEFMKNPDVYEIINMDNKTFKDKYGFTAASWRGKSLLQRNALINLMYNEKNSKIILNTTSPYVNEYYHRLLKLITL